MTLRELNPRMIRRRPVIRPRVRTGPINRPIILAVVFAGISYVAWPKQPDDVLYSWSAVAALYSAALGALAFTRLVRDHRLRRQLAVSEMTSEDHGSARASTREERVAIGMDDSRNGELLGLDDGGYAVWRPANAPFLLCEMPPGAGKTASLVIGSILHRAMLGQSVVVPDIKNDLAPTLTPALQAKGIEVWNINPAELHLDRAGIVVLNPYQPVLDSVWGDPDARMDAFKYAADFGLVHVAQPKGDQNPYFTLGARRVVIIAIILLAYFDPGNCTPTGVYLLLADQNAFLKLCVRAQYAAPFDGNDDLVNAIRSEALSMLARAKKNKDNFSSFLEQATQSLTSFNPSGRLGHYGREAFLNIAAIRSRPIVVFISTPLSHMREFAPFVSLINQNIIAACKAKPDGHPVHIVGEEALNYRFTDLVADLETMRQLRVTADFYIQSFAGLERNYGKESAAAIESYADVRIYAGLNSLDRAKHVSALLSDETLRTQDVSHGTSPTDLNLSTREIARPLMKPDEILTMPRGEPRAARFEARLQSLRTETIDDEDDRAMIDWIEKLPEPLLPVATAACIWFGFNYAVLADRAIANDHAVVALPHCLDTLERSDLALRVRPSGLGRALGVPQLDQFERVLIDQYRPQPLSLSERQERCSCATRKASGKLRWDYAVHTASFRIVSAESAAAMSDEVASIVLSGVCGALPKLRIGD